MQSSDILTAKNRPETKVSGSDDDKAKRLAEYAAVRDLVTLCDKAHETYATSADRRELIPLAVRDALSGVIKCGALKLPEHSQTPADGRYARHLLYKSEKYGYTIVAMVWRAGQGSDIHDHNNNWCVEGVVQGVIEVTPYHAFQTSDGLYRFEKDETTFSGFGNAGNLIPPFEYHTIRNPRDKTAISVHIYESEYTECRVFSPSEPGSNFYVPHTQILPYD